MKRNIALSCVAVALCAVGFLLWQNNHGNRHLQDSTPGGKLTAEQKTGANPSAPRSAQSQNQNNPELARKRAEEDATKSAARPAWVEPTNAEKVLSRKLAQSGERFAAVATLADGSTKTPMVNEIGQTEFIKTKTGENVNLSVSYPNGTPGQRVVVAAYDGGIVNDTPSKATVVTLDESRNANFKFKVGPDEGRYLITLTKGSDEKNVRIWAGKEIPMAKR